MRKTKLYQSCHASRPRSCHRSHRRRGITSACAEQTNGSTTDAPRRRDHLRVCGADLESLTRSESGTGSPPRVRSRLRVAETPHQGHGITSACAEQTPTMDIDQIMQRDHLRVCGADSHWIRQREGNRGSPPRVRSRPPSHAGRHVPQRITSACAEQTATFLCSTCRCRDHLRVCGADTSLSRMSPGRGGSPPRVRSRHGAGVVGDACGGITSACAEQTFSYIHMNPTRWDHLRVCGADLKTE